MKKTLSLALLSSIFALTACDQTDDYEPGSSLRAGYKKYKATSVSATFSIEGTDDPFGDPMPGWPFIGFEVEVDVIKLEVAAVVRNADAIYASAFAGSEQAEAMCPEVCAAEDLEWNGRVAAAGQYDVGEADITETDEGMGYQTEVHAEVEMQCVCMEG